MVKVEELDIYRRPFEEGVLIKDKALFPEPYIKEAIGRVRQSTRIFEMVSQRFDQAVDFYQRSCRTIEKNVLSDQVKREQPKITAISLAAVAGLLMGKYKGSNLSIVKYTLFASASTASFCYPEETWTLLRQCYDKAEREWRRFQESPKPPVAKNLAPTQGDAQLYTTRSDKIN